jgi:hypothetical protein
MNRDFYQTLKSFGTDPTAIRAVFTAQSDKLSGDGLKIFEREKARIEAEERNGKEMTKKQGEKLKGRMLKKFSNSRAKFENRILSRVHEGRLRGLNTYRFYKVADLAWEQGVNTENIPLQLYTQGKINIDQTVSQLKKCVKDKKMTQDQYDQVVVSDPQTPNDIKGLNLPRLHEISINLVRSYIRRRVAAQANKYNDLYPYYSYEPRSKDMVSKLRADVLSQRIETITDQFGYRHDFTQCLRKNFLYSHCLSFVESAWEEHKQFRSTREPSGNSKMEPYVVKEGVKWCSPHPTRVFHDVQHSMASVNHDSGIKYLGYWDVIRWRDINDNPKYFNRDSIPFSQPEHFDQFRPYFEYYYCPTQIKFPSHFNRGKEEGNNRQSNLRTRYYTGNLGDDSMWVANYYEKITPKQVGIGHYPYPVWIRLVVASDRTVIHGEILPSKPAAYMGHDEDDSKMQNLSMAHEIIPYQDQVSNLFSQATYLMKIQSILVMALDTDQLSTEQRKQIKGLAKGSKYYSELMLIERSESKRQEIFGQPPQTREPITLTQTQAKLGNVINELLSNVSTVIGLLDKNQMMSPQEAGNFAKRETTAQEVFEVSQTTNALFSFISEGPDEYRNARKKILYESLLALGSDEVNVYVQERYPDEIITAAGFESQRPDGVSSGYELQDADAQNLMGDIESIAMEYMFNSRDGSERTISTAAGKTIGDLTRYIFSTPQIFEKFVSEFGIDQITNMISEVFRLSGSGFILKVPANAQNKEAQVAELMAQLQGQLEENNKTSENSVKDISSIQSQLDLIRAELGLPDREPTPTATGEQAQAAAPAEAPPPFTPAPEPVAPPTVLAG